MPPRAEARTPINSAGGSIVISKRLALAATAALSVGLVASAQQGPPQQGGERPSVQVGVPQGRGPGGPGRGRNPGPPPGPAPRNADGRVLLGGATPKDKGVWLPGGGGFQGVQSQEPVPFQPWAKAVYDDRQKN